MRALKTLSRWLDPSDALTPMGAIRWWVTGNVLLLLFTWIWLQVR